MVLIKRDYHRFSEEIETMRSKMIFISNLFLATSSTPRAILRKVVPLTLFLTVALNTGAKAEEGIDPERWIREAESILAQVESYTAIFHKQERVKGWLKTKEMVHLKFKKPFKVYMKWIEDPGKGREILYIDGWNNNRILLRDPGFMGVVIMNLRPQGPIAMKGSRHPITEVGLGHLVKMFRDNIRRGLWSGELECRRGKEGRVYGRRIQSLELIFPKESRNGYYCYRSVVSLDIEKRVPIRVQVFDWEDRLIEDYGYEDLTLNAGLSDAEFDPKNPEYRF
jgi:outer membrane lipoprotein-sorting protein